MTGVLNYLKNHLLQRAKNFGISTNFKKMKINSNEYLAIADCDSYSCASNNGAAVAESNSTAIAKIGLLNIVQESVAIAQNYSLAIGTNTVVDDHSIAIANNIIYIGDDCLGIVITNAEEINKVEMFAGSRSSIVIIVQNEEAPNLNKAFTFNFNAVPVKNELEAYNTYRFDLDKSNVYHLEPIKIEERD